GHIVSHTDIDNDITTTYETDLLGRSRQQQTAELFPVTTLYPQATQIIRSINGMRRSEMSLDAFGRTQSAMAQADMDNGYQVVRRDSLGRILNTSVVKEDPTGPEFPDFQDNPGFYTYNLDILDRPRQIHDPVEPDTRGNRDPIPPTSVEYSPFSKEVTNPRGDTTTYEYDAVGRLIRVIMPDTDGITLTTDYTYDYLGNLLTVRQASSGDVDVQTRWFRYNTLGQRISEYHPETGYTAYIYESTGARRLTGIRHGDGSIETFAYDGFGRLVQHKYIETSGVAKQKVMIYDDDPVTIGGYTVPEPLAEAIHEGLLKAQISSIDEGSGPVFESAIIYPGYTILGRPYSKILLVGTGGSVTAEITAGFEYDYIDGTESYGDLIGITCSGTINGTPVGDAEIDYIIKAATGNLDSVFLDGTPVAHTMEHEVFGATKSITYQNGAYISAGYNDGNLLNAKTEDDFAFTYEYNPNNAIKEITVDRSGSPVLTQLCNYDSWNRLIHSDSIPVGGDAHSSTFEYDAMNNMTRTVYQIGSEVVEDATFTYHWSVIVGTGDNSSWGPYAYRPDTGWEESPGAAPGYRTGHALCRSPRRHSVMLFGGRDNENAPLADLWQYSESNQSWAEVTAYDSPSARYDHAMAFHPGLNRVVLFGGDDGRVRLDETWLYDSAGTTWTNVGLTLGTEWSDPVMSTFEDTVILMVTAPSGPVMYRMEGMDPDADLSWIRVDGCELPEEMSGYRMVWHSVAQRVIMVGMDQGTMGTYIYPHSDGSPVWEKLVLTAELSTLPDSLARDPADESVICVTGGTVYRLDYVGAGFSTDGWQNFSPGPGPQEMMLAGMGGHQNLSSSYVFDERGRRIEDASAHYTVNAANEVVTIEDPATRETVAEYTYDPTGKRVREIRYDGATEETLYRLYLGEVPVFDMWPDGTYRVYVHGDGRLLATADYDGVTPDPEMQYFLYDHLGSTAAVLDGNGDTVWPPPGGIVNGMQMYRPYGEFATDAGEMGTEIPSFTGKFADPGTGNHYFNARYHTSDSSMAAGPNQFMSPDPIYGRLGDPLSWNRMTYCHNNPVMYTDPTGKYFTWENWTSLKALIDYKNYLIK
ncbi:MAG TPA: RHS repeat-associated core domain-containing protein, partial [bacterium]|nr:RHS repeat-associated core domain-containing protein [bacterium]